MFLYHVWQNVIYKIYTIEAKILSSTLSSTYYVKFISPLKINAKYHDESFIHSILV